MQLYAAAVIGWYLLAEPGPADDVVLRLHRLDGSDYVEDMVARGAGPLRMTEPFPFAVEPRSLLGR